MWSSLDDDKVKFELWSSMTSTNLSLSLQVNHYAPSVWPLDGYIWTKILLQDFLKTVKWVVNWWWLLGASPKQYHDVGAQRRTSDHAFFFLSSLVWYTMHYLHIFPLNFFFFSFHNLDDQPEKKGIVCV